MVSYPYYQYSMYHAVCTFNHIAIKLQDAFQHGNVVQLLVRSNGYPLRVCNKELMAFGDFTPECKSLLFN